MQFDAKEALNGSSMFAENSNGGVSSNSNAYHLDVNAFMHMLNNFNKIGNVLIDGQNYFGNSIDKGKGYIANVVFGQDYHDIDISKSVDRGIIMSGENGRLPNIKGGSQYVRVILSENDSNIPAAALDFSNLSQNKAESLKNITTLETYFNQSQKNISLPGSGSRIFYFGNNYKTNMDHNLMDDSHIYAASISTYEEIGNELIGQMSSF